MTLSASFPMYDFEEVRGAHDVLWASIARRLERAGVEGVPAALDRGRGVHELWTDAGLILSQCCGADLMGRYAEELTLIATPRYSAPGCDGCLYSSAILVAADSPATELEDLRGAVCVVNSHESHSGTNALRELLAPLNRQGRFFSRIVVSGSHLASTATVAKGEADLASIDCVTYALADRYRPSLLEGTRRLCYSARAPGIPFVTRAESSEDLIRNLQRALMEAFDEPEVRAAGAAMFIEGVEVLPLSAYELFSRVQLWISSGAFCPNLYAAFSSCWSRHAGHDVVGDQSRSTVRTPPASCPCWANHSSLQRAPRLSMRD